MVIRRKKPITDFPVPVYKPVGPPTQIGDFELLAPSVKLSGIFCEDRKLEIRELEEVDLVQSLSKIINDQGNKGAVFDQSRSNFLLPPHPDPLYYRRWRIKNNDPNLRGAMRIVVGKGGEAYLTADHYDSFVKVTL